MTEDGADKAGASEEHWQFRVQHGRGKKFSRWYDVVHDGVYSSPEGTPRVTQIEFRKKPRLCRGRYCIGATFIHCHYTEDDPHPNGFHTNGELYWLNTDKFSR